MPLISPSIRRLTARIEGRVQGVGFRAFVVRHARRLCLRGAARNLPDGGVEVIAEGDEARLRELLTALRQGPPGSAVTEVEATWGEASGEFPDFRVTY